MVHPVPRALDADPDRIGEVRRPFVLDRVRGPALRAAHQQGRARDPLPGLHLVRRAHPVRRLEANVVVELPAIGPVLVLAHPVHGEVAGLLGGEVGVLLLHAPEGVLDARVAPRRPPGELPHVVDPADEPFRARDPLPAPQAGRRPHPLDGDELHHVLGVEPRVLERDGPPERVRDDGGRREAGLVEELRDVVHVVRQHVGAALDPLGVPVAPEVGGDDVVVLAERLGHPVPAPAMVPPAVHEEEGRRVRVAPVHVVEAKALGEVDVGGRSVNGRRHARVLSGRGGCRGGGCGWMESIGSVRTGRV